MVGMCNHYLLFPPLPLLSQPESYYKQGHSSAFKSTPTCENMWRIGILKLLTVFCQCSSLSRKLKKKALHFISENTDPGGWGDRHPHITGSRASVIAQMHSQPWVDVVGPPGVLGAAGSAESLSGSYHHSGGHPSSWALCGIEWGPLHCPKRPPPLPHRGCSYENSAVNLLLDNKSPSQNPAPEEPHQKTEVF